MKGVAGCIKTLAGGFSLLNIPLVPLADVSGVIASLFKNLSKGDFIFI